MIFSKNLIFSALIPLFFPIIGLAQNCSVEITNTTTKICKGDVVKIIAHGTPAGGTYTWSGTNIKAKSFDLSVSKDTTFHLTYTAPDNCIARDTIKIQAIGFDASLAALPERDTIEQGETLVLVAKTVPVQGSFTYTWQENNTLMLGNNNATVETIADTNLPTYSYSVQIADKDGCKKNLIKTFVIIEPLFAIPNAFTPDGDAINDRFALIPVRGTLDIESLQIYNRWGEKLYEGMGMTAAWDGTFNGQLQPMGVYYYVARVRKGKGASLSIRHGEINLLR